MEKHKRVKEHGGGFDFHFKKEEIKKVLVEKIIEEGEEIPCDDEVDVTYNPDSSGGGFIIVQGKRRS